MADNLTSFLDINAFCTTERRDFISIQQYDPFSSSILAFIISIEAQLQRADDMDSIVDERIAFLISEANAKLAALCPLIEEAARTSCGAAKLVNEYERIAKEIIDLISREIKNSFPTEVEAALAIIKLKIGFITFGLLRGILPKLVPNPIAAFLLGLLLGYVAEWIVDQFMAYAEQLVVDKILSDENINLDALARDIVENWDIFGGVLDSGICELVKGQIVDVQKKFTGHGSDLCGIDTDHYIATLGSQVASLANCSAGDDFEALKAEFDSYKLLNCPQKSASFIVDADGNIVPV